MPIADKKVHVTGDSTGPFFLPDTSNINCRASYSLKQKHQDRVAELRVSPSLQCLQVCEDAEILSLRSMSSMTSAIPHDIFFFELSITLSLYLSTISGAYMITMNCILPYEPVDNSVSWSRKTKVSASAAAADTIRHTRRKIPRTRNHIHLINLKANRLNNALQSEARSLYHSR